MKKALVDYQLMDRDRVTTRVTAGFVNQHEAQIRALAAENQALRERVGIAEREIADIHLLIEMLQSKLG